MQCPRCEFDNREDAKFCKKCGTKIELACPGCGTRFFPFDKYCDECGYDLRKTVKGSNVDSTSTDSYTTGFLTNNHIKESPLDGERKQVTVLFSDLSGYTALSEKLDPEELKEITIRIFGEVSKVIGKYDGFLEKYVGDAVMAIFGVPRTHEDDPLRAIKAAKEIHELVNAVSPDVKNRTGLSISMHTGINTGLVVTGEVDIERGTHGVAGDTINLASRLSNIAEPDEILVNIDTYRQIEGHFKCETAETTTVKGKSEPVEVHRVLYQKEKPVTIRRLSGLRADLVGRRVEMMGLNEAVESLLKGKGSIFSVIGHAGTGKSRLVEDFKTTLDPKRIQWVEGHAFAYTQNTPYFPMIDLLNRVFEIKEGDSIDIVREKIESGIKNLIESHKEVIPFVGGLFSLRYPEFEEVSPEFWKFRLQESITAVLSALAKGRPTVFFLEDLHWADPSSVELLRRSCLEIRQPAIVLCVYRPVFSLFENHQLNSIRKIYSEIRLKDLSSSESQEMVQSLLKTEKIPSELQRFIQEKMEGNPFYLEEAINSLIESNTLIQKDGIWQIKNQITDIDISSTIQGVISARVDRLEQESKRILQEASVIGRSFYYKILKRVTVLKNSLDIKLTGLERQDLIKTKSIQPDLEYIFKHSLIQEVIYNGLLKKERKRIHERVATVIEKLFQYRLAELYETLAFHFSRGLSLNKAINYLMKSAKKSLARYAIEESHQYYQQAFDILNSKLDRTKTENKLLIELIIDWAYVFYYRGYFKEMSELFRPKIKIAETLEDRSNLGMVYSWYGWGLLCQHIPLESYPYFEKALQIGEEEKDQRLIGYACTWLTWYHLMTGRLDLSIKYGERTQDVSKTYKSDAYLYFKSLCGLGYAYIIRGNKKKGIEIGNELIGYGKKHSNIRSLTVGYAVLGSAYQMDNDLIKSIEFFEKAIQVGVEPFYVEYIRLNLAVEYIRNDQIAEAENALNCVIAFGKKSGAGIVEIPAQIYSGAVLIAKGEMDAGFKILREGKVRLFKDGNMINYLQCEYILAKIFSQIAGRTKPINLSTITQNIGFMVKNVPFAAKKAEAHFKKVIENAQKIGAKAFLGSAYMDLGLLHKSRKRKEQAHKYICEAIKIFEQCEAEICLKQANDALESLK